jgi:hypothetical protein
MGVNSPQKQSCHSRVTFSYNTRSEIMKFTSLLLRNHARLTRDPHLHGEVEQLRA